MSASTLAVYQPFSSYSEQDEKVENCTKPLIFEVMKNTTQKRSTYLERAEKNPTK